MRREKLKRPVRYHILTPSHIDPVEGDAVDYEHLPEPQYSFEVEFGETPTGIRLGRRGVSRRHSVVLQ
jgi:hypothetical protein